MVSDVKMSRRILVSLHIYYGVALLLLSNNPQGVTSFLSTPLRCSLKEPKPAFEFNLPKNIPSFFAPSTNSMNNHGSMKNNNNNRMAASMSDTFKKPTSTSFPVQLQESTEKKKETEASTMQVPTKPVNNTVASSSAAIDTLETRGAIMEHALQVKNGELETLNRRNVLLQDVVKKLQVSNRNLLDKVHELQHEKEGTYIYIVILY